MSDTNTSDGKIKQIQTVLSVTADGKFGTNSRAALSLAGVEERKTIQTILGVKADGIFGSKSQAALENLLTPSFSTSTLPSATMLKGDGTWPFTARIDGDDIVCENIRMTCFGGGSDPQDSGETASGISTKKNPDLAACSLPMDGQQFSGFSKDEHGALDGSPIPRIPFKTIVRVTANGKTIDCPVIDLGPGKRTGNALDLTIAAARLFNPEASATNFEARGSFRILGAAKYAKT